MKNFFIKIYDFFRYDIPYGIRNLVVWFPVIWKDRDWDNHYIFVVLRKKLYLTEQNFRTNGHHEDDIQQADQIKECVHLLDRLINDVYHDIAFGELYKRWGHPVLKTEKDGAVYIEYPNVKTVEDESLLEYEYGIACKYEERLEKQDRKRLFEIMKLHIKEWWD